MSVPLLDINFDRFSLEKLNQWAISHLLPGSVCNLKILEFQESDFKAFKVLEIGFWSLKVLDFLMNKIEKYQCVLVLK